jgi:nicotinamidase-related amidase
MTNAIAAYKPLTSQNTALVLVDHQVGLLTGVRDYSTGELKHNVVALAKAAKALKVPIVVTTTARDSLGGPLFLSFLEALPGVEIIDRSSVNPFDDARVARAIEATGRKKLIFAGISLELCAAFPAITAAGKGLDAYVAVDASGTFSETKRQVGLLRLLQAGVILSDYATLMVEILSDNARPEAGEVDDFLSYRCSKDFLALYVEDEKVLKMVADPGLALDACSEVRLAVRLHQCGVLPEQYRKAFVEKVMAYAFDGDDFYGLENKGIQSVFTSEEMAQFRKRVHDDLIPKLSDVSSHWMHDFFSSASPEDIMQPLLESYKSLKQQFSSEPALARMIQQEIDSVNEWIAEKMAERDSPRERAPRVFGEMDASEPPSPGTRSIFDDVDD